MSLSRPLNLHLPNSLDHSIGLAGLAAVLLRSHHGYLADSLWAAHPLDHAVGHDGQFADDDDSVQDRQGHGVGQRPQAAVAVALALAAKLRCQYYNIIYIEQVGWELYNPIHHRSEELSHRIVLLQMPWLPTNVTKGLRLRDSPLSRLAAVTLIVLTATTSARSS